MKSRKVYEALGDIFKGKDVNDLKQHMNLSGLNDVFQDVMVALIEKGYLPQPIPEASEDYRKNVYSYMGKKIVSGDAAWIKLKAKEELDDMDFFFHDSFNDEVSSTDSMVHIMELEDGAYSINVSVNFRGTWKTRTDDEEDLPYFDDRIDVNSADKVVAATMKQVNKAEIFLQSEIDRLKKYAEQW